MMVGDPDFQGGGAVLWYGLGRPVITSNIGNWSVLRPVTLQEEEEEEEET